MIFVVTLHGNTELDSLYTASVYQKICHYRSFPLSGPTPTRRSIHFRWFANQHSGSNDSGTHLDPYGNKGAQLALTFHVHVFSIL